ncbi:glutamine--tRNA ligase/YqeY domain fusion protein [Meiothermus sp. QL-1]|uniref:glutamine--tRNA ligase/YqeY domain fusion protein n=1 Tax=Meiothermus sp. QL-1 TaxID=2058095 RepID=UPI000E0AABD6|nr:glutamine--tRNA ligase/YqeY domain fusion protein [Meiothermus sp. QL-1]RDI95684.1 glutamine--tRNA ligase/YqeY domain fusion protein [Meiothermus sp. QL-1]
MRTLEGKPRYVAPNFITEIIEEDLRAGRYQKIVTRFPPEPNGYAHLGHAIASYIDFGIALDYGGECRLRMDDTNPETERAEYAEALIADMRWLGWDWGERVRYASDYFEELYQMAEKLILKGLAYVDSVSPEEMARLRGTVDTPGTPSPYRERSVEENLDLFRRMRAGEFKNGEHVLRAKIDLSSPNMKLRDPVLYRIVHAEHYRTGKQWCIYPSYDFAQATTDALDGVTHSLCSLEFVDNRAIYDWLMDHLWGEPPLHNTPRPRQYEFGRRSLEYTVVSKRKLRKLVEGGYVRGWDDPRLPTLAGQRRRGVRPEAIRRFAAQVGVSRTNRTVDIALLEAAIRDDLNHIAPRVMAVIRPLRVVLTNLEAPRSVSLPYWPPDVVQASPDGLVPLPSGARVQPEAATRTLTLGPVLFIEQDDFSPNPPKGYKRLTPGGTVRLKRAGVIRCEAYRTNEQGEVVELTCTYLGEEGQAAGVIHWLSQEDALPAEFRLYDRLFTVPHPEAEAREQEEEGEEDLEFLRFLNPQSLVVAHGYVEKSVLGDPPDTRYQFERNGYFWQDPVDSSPGALVFNRIVSLKDTWARRMEAEKPTPAQSPPPPRPSPGAPSLDLEAEARLQRYRTLGIPEAEARVLAREARLAAFLEEALGQAAAPGLASLVVNELAPAIRSGTCRVSPEGLAGLVRLLESGQISSRIAKDALAEAQQTGEDPAALIARKGLRRLDDPAALEPLIEGVLAKHPDKVRAYRAGKTGLLGFFVGQVMQETQGQADPEVAQALLRQKLG